MYNYLTENKKSLFLKGQCKTICTTMVDCKIATWKNNGDDSYTCNLIKDEAVKFEEDQQWTTYCKTDCKKKFERHSQRNNFNLFIIILVFLSQKILKFTKF